MIESSTLARQFAILFPYVTLPLELPLIIQSGEARSNII